MALRLIEAFVPADDLDEVDELLEERPVLGCWKERLAGGIGLVRILVPPEETEGLGDALVERFGRAEGFRIVLLPVEATIPAPEEEEAAGDEARGDADAEAAEEAEAGIPLRVSREELYQDISDAATLRPVYLVTVGLSAVVASVGLIRGDVAIIIGAMVIAPLLGPNVALALASTLGDGTLARVAGRAILAGLALALALSVLVGAIFPVNPEVPELLSRTRAGLSDVAVALAAGSAGTLAYTTGISAAIIGVMVAVALLPPLVATGLLAGAGFWPLAIGAFLLVITNVTCVNLAAVVTFLVQRVGPRSWWEEERAKRATRLALVSWVVTLAALVVAILLARG